MARLFKRSDERKSLWQKIKDVALMDATTAMQGMNQGSLEKLEEVLLASDFGVKATLRLVDHVEELNRRGQARTERDFLQAVETEVRDILETGEHDTTLHFAPKGELTVYLMVGVNGVGKTTTIGKLAARLAWEGKKVILAAGDTFRAAATEQLEVWAKRAGAAIVTGKEGSDPGAIVFEAVKRAQTESFDVVIADTAGRLHTKVPLMEELRKVKRVMGKALEGAPHEVLLVLDATTGQNAIAQARQFHETLQVTSIALSKLDGTAKGGVIIGICDELKIPVRYVGVGEAIEDLKPFDPKEFVGALFAA